MSDKSRWSFKFSFNRRTHLSYYCAAILLVTAIISYFAVNIINERRELKAVEEMTPKLDLDLWKKDIQAFHERTGRYAKNLKELESVIWNSRDNRADSRLTNGDNVFVYNRYMVVYRANGQVCSLWAIPLGELRNQANSYFLLIAPKQIQTWKGASLSNDDIERLPTTVVPSHLQMARLGMSMQDADKLEDKPKQTFFTPFGKK